MMDRYLFRGKRVDNGEWVEGSLDIGGILDDYVYNKELTFILLRGEGLERIQVIPETVGQCTGLSDKSGKLIYEGDVLQRKEDNRQFSRRHNWDYIVQWSEGDYKWIVECYNGDMVVHPNLTTHSGFEIIGNIHEESL